jgi:hypothetical protein
MHDLTTKQRTFGSRDDVLRIMELSAIVKKDESKLKKIFG